MANLGNTLVRAREARGLTLEDAERDTRISRRYLQALETEQYHAIPAPVYARGFLRSYSQYLGLNPQEVLKLFPSDDDAVDATAGVPARASREHPIPSTSPSRPAWTRPAAAPRTPSRARDSVSPRKPPLHQPKPEAETATGREAVIGEELPPSTGEAFQEEPLIGVNVGVPVPARRLERDPAASTRTLVVIAIALAAVLVVGILAFLISRLGGEDSGTSGAAAPAQLTQAAAQRPAVTQESLTVPKGVVPEVVGLASGRAEALVKEAGYQVEVKREKSPTVPKGSVIDQAPAAGTQWPESQPVRLVVSEGP